MSLPDPLPPRRVPLVVIVGGLGTGWNTVRALLEVGDPGPNAIVGYDWPLPERDPGLAEIARHAAAYRRNVLSVPGQLDAILAWGARQAWADPARVSLLGFSLGAFEVPAAQRIAEERGVAIRATVLGYGGAPIGAVIAGHPGVRHRWARRLLGAVADVFLRPVEPSNHLPHLHGRFLVLGAASDRIMARAASERLAALTPEPKTVLWVEGDHTGLAPEKRKLLSRAVDATCAWLRAEGAMDSPAAAPARAVAAPP